MKYTLNFQPVIPITLNDDWNLITRTIVPTIYLEATAPGVSSKFGLGDITQSFFLSPKEPVAGWILGGGPAMLYPSATDSARILDDLDTPEDLRRFEERTSRGS